MDMKPGNPEQLSHFTVTTGDLRMSPRGEVDERTMEMLKPIVRAGLGIIAGLSILLKHHHVDKNAEVWVFTLGFKHDVAAVRCWLSRTPMLTSGSSECPSRQRPGSQ
jgi:hypothetical protein